MAQGTPIYALARLKDGNWIGIARDPAELCTVWKKTPMATGLRQLTGTQLRTVIEAAQQLLLSSREAFLRKIAARLDGRGGIVGDGDVHRALRQAAEELRLERVVRL
jgi:hypothetical protein